MLHFNFTPFPLLKTERLVLRQAAVIDAPEIFFLRSDPGVLKYIGREPATSIEDAYQFLQIIDDAATNNTGISWSIALKENNKMIGTIALWKLTPEHHRGEIGYVLHPAYQGKGIMHEAMAAVIDYAFSAMKLHSIEAKINPENLASQRLLERNNFVREAYFRENYYHKGQFFDSAIYSLLTPVKEKVE